MDFNIYNGLMTGVLLLVASAVVVPLFATHRKLAGTLNFLACLAAALIFTGVACQVLIGTGAPATFDLHLGGLVMPLMIDGFSAVFMALISLMATVTAFYCIGYMEMDHYRHYSLRSFFFCYPVFVAGMIGIVTVDDLTTGFTIAWQMMTLASFFLIRFDYKDETIVRNANKYLLLMELAWAAVLAAGLMVPGCGWGASLHQIAENLGVVDTGLRTLLLALAMLGFGMKAGMFPLGQLWLPDAHSVAPSPISAMLSGVMIKTGVYGMLRTLFWMTPDSMPAHELQYWGLVTAFVGVVTLFIGTAQAVKQVDAKRLHAYSSIGQIGYIIMAIGCARYYLGHEAGLQALALLALFGALCHTLNHAVFKGLLFLCTGSVQYTTGTKDLDKLGGLFGLMPVTAVIAGIAAIAVSGVPAFSGFTSKWAIVGAALLPGKAAGIFVIFGVIALVTSAMTLATYVKFYGMTFTSVGVEWNEKNDIHEVSTAMLLPKLVLAAVCLVQGLFPFLFVALFGRVLATSAGSITQVLGTPEMLSSLAQSYAGVTLRLGDAPVAFSLPLVMIAMLAVAMLFALWLRKAGGAEERTAPVWLCGYQTLNNANRYLSSHIFDAFKKFMKWTGGNVRGA
ncbi:oxidoreductase [Chitiniphilus shinanonensis]|uniref:Hydrogenase-4, component B n=1 Tax=Chitiniphilus shinanonensis TaxID=553088 RepID=F8WSV9_9NEIS|nr:proton-conducting transporter membrane subunit [Chitiniphilus shinanonensis]BAK53946.1 hydrogenase-4, component B [Chitiniphilus shinanonensis]GLS05050.1 oxidoreductase [Chitiniphilus shinanonensis]